MKCVHAIVRNVLSVCHCCFLPEGRQGQDNAAFSSSPEIKVRIVSRTREKGHNLCFFLIQHTHLGAKDEQNSLIVATLGRHIFRPEIPTCFPRTNDSYPLFVSSCVYLCV